MIDRNKIGVVVTTFNSENYFETLFNSLPDDRYGPLVVVNGGEPYTKLYKRMHGEVHWIQHETNFGPARSRNDGLKKLYDLGCDHMFCIEDDIIIKSEDIFDAYINASKITGLQYFCWVSYPWEAGSTGNRTPRFKVQYSDKLTINLYKNSCNEVTYRTRNLYEKIGIENNHYDENFKYMFDVDNYYRITQLPEGHVFWNSPDLSNGDDFIMNNPDAISRLDYDGKRIQRLGSDMEYFENKHGLHVSKIKDATTQEVINKLQRIKDSIK